jgi:hypothetical protein
MPQSCFNTPAMGRQAFRFGKKLNIIGHFSQISFCQRNHTPTPEKMIGR